jgi:hypothetical protein
MSMRKHAVMSVVIVVLVAGIYVVMLPSKTRALGECIYEVDKAASPGMPDKMVKVAVCMNARGFRVDPSRVGSPAKSDDPRLLEADAWLRHRYW